MKSVKHGPICKRHGQIFQSYLHKLTTYQSGSLTVTPASPLPSFAMPSITQIISFVTKSTVDFEYLSDAAKAGTKGLQRQFLGSGLEPNARVWLLGELSLSTSNLSMLIAVFQSH